MQRQMRVPTRVVRADGLCEEFRTDDVVIEHFQEGTVVTLVNPPLLQNGDSMVFEWRVFELADDKFLALATLDMVG